jgi:hypothetical protein
VPFFLGKKRKMIIDYSCRVHFRSHWPRSVRRRSPVARLLGLWFRIPPEAWRSVSWECCVLSGRGLCDELITRPEESYRTCCVVVCDRGTSKTRRPWLAIGRNATKKKSASLYRHRHHHHHYYQNHYDVIKIHFK